MTKHTPKDGPTIHGGSQDARRTAALILDVLAGVLRPADAAQVLGIGLPRYYILERRSLEGLVAACEPRPKGPMKNSEKQIEELKITVKRLENEVLRYQALSRAAHRAIGVAGRVDAVKKSKNGKKHFKPQVRAKKVSRS
ncbi:MAG: hypothetical protein ACYTGH_21745, partial [Planctomycetota bacterium]